MPPSRLTDRRPAPQLTPRRRFRRIAVMANGRRTLAGCSLALALLLAGGGLVGAAASAGADEEGPPRIYKWVDENGIAHYTTDPDTIPSNLRDRFLPLRRAMERVRESAPEERAAPAEKPLASPAGETERWAVRDAGPDGSGPLPESTISSEPIADGTSVARAAPRLDPAEREALRRARADLDQRIAALEATIAEDEETLKALISREPAAEGTGLAADSAFREIAKRLPGLQEDLRALRDERSRLEARE